MWHILIKQKQNLPVHKFEFNKVRSNSCVIPYDFKKEIKQCYSDWAASVEETATFGPYVGQNITNNSSA